MGNNFIRLAMCTILVLGTAGLVTGCSKLGLLTSDETKAIETKLNEEGFCEKHHVNVYVDANTISSPDDNCVDLWILHDDDSVCERIRDYII